MEKKKIVILILLCLTAVIVWASGIKSGGESERLGALVEVSADQETQIVAVVAKALEIYNAHGPSAIRRIFSAGGAPAKSWEMAGVPDPVEQSLTVLTSCGKGLAPGSPRVRQVSNTARNSRQYVVAATVNAAGDRLIFEITKRQNGYRLGNIARED